MKTEKSTLLPLLTDGKPDTDQPTAADENLLVGGIGEVFQGYQFDCNDGIVRYLCIQRLMLQLFQLQPMSF